MQVGLIGAGNMARAVARGGGKPVLCSDGGSGRARALAEEIGGEAPSNAEAQGQVDAAVRQGLAAPLASRLAVDDDRRRRGGREPSLMVLFALTRGDVAKYVDALFLVYIILILVYILANLLFSFGLRPPYSRWTDAILNFLRDVCEPYLGLFRRFIPPIGMFDLSPMIGLFVLYFVRVLVVNAIHG